MDHIDRPDAGGVPALAHLGFWALPEQTRTDAFAQLRQREKPAFIPFRNPMPFAHAEDGFYAIVCHADIIKISRMPELFSSEPNAGSLYDLPPWLNRHFNSMINMNGPPHRRIRTIVARAFSSHQVAQLEENIQERAERIVDDLLNDDPRDFISQVAQRLPLETLCDIMGVPEQHHQLIARHSNTILGYNDPEHTGISRAYLLRHGSPGRRHILPLSRRLTSAAAELTTIVRQLARDRMRHPRNDLISTLTRSDDDGQRLTPREVGTLFILLILAGTETTRSTLAHTLKLLTENPEQRDILLGDIDTHLAGAVEEAVRHASPVIQFRRTVTRHCEFHGQPFKPGDKLLLFYNSANRDEAVFPNPDRFDITRSSNPHLGFGGPGPHVCLGVGLARRQSITMLRTLFTWLPDIRTVGQPDMLLSNFNNGIKRMPFQI
jgi:cytochrome P450